MNAHSSIGAIAVAQQATNHPSDDQVIAWLNERNVVGPFDADFINEMRDAMAESDLIRNIRLIRQSDERMIEFASRLRAEGLYAFADIIEKMRREDRSIGTHPLVFDRTIVTDGLPDLTVGRTLDDAIHRLDQIEYADGDIPTGWMEYADAWLEEVRDIGIFASVTYWRDGTVDLNTGFPCDQQMDERRRRLGTLSDHMRKRDGAREAIMLQVEREGHVADNRPVIIGDLIAATREFIRTGGQLLLDAQGKPEGKANIELLLASDDSGASQAHCAAAKAFHELAQRGRARRPLARIVRLCGEASANGWHVLSAKPVGGAA